MMNDEQRSRIITGYAVRAAFDQLVDEPKVEYCGQRYGESELRRLRAAGQLDTLPERLAAGVPSWLDAINHDQKRVSGFTVGTGDGGWIGFMPLSADYLLPPGWQPIGPVKCYLFGDADDE